MVIHIIGNLFWSHWLWWQITQITLVTERIKSEMSVVKVFMWLAFICTTVTFILTSSSFYLSTLTTLRDKPMSLWSLTWWEPLTSQPLLLLPIGYIRKVRGVARRLCLSLSSEVKLSMCERHFQSKGHR